MKKAEELVLYTPKPVRPNLDARLCVSVAEGKGQGRYIKGKTLTVAVWDKCKNPVVTWRFCGDYWIGELRKKPENNFKKDFSPKGIWEKAGKVLFWADVSATSEDSKRLHDYFNDYRENLMAVVDGALTARARKRLDKRNAQQAEETEKWFKKVPEPAEVDLKKQILTECYDAVYLWATNTKKLVVTPGGVGKYIPAQQIRCDSCGGEYTLTDRKLKHKSSEICKCCGKKMTVRGTQYSSKRLCAKRTFVWSKKQGTGVWLRKYAVYFGFANHKAKMNIYAEGIWWTDGKEILRWEKRWQNHCTEQKYVMCQNSRLSAALLAPGSYMQPTIIADYGEKVERDLHGVMHTEWLRELDKDLNFYWEIIFWEATLKYPMAESLMKTGWLDAMTDILDGTKTAGCIKLSSKTYYGVFGGLNRQELNAVVAQGQKKSFERVKWAATWKKAGLPIDCKHLAMTEQIQDVMGMCDTLQKYGMTRSLKYLRQQTRRVTGKYDGHIVLRVAQDWSDYLDMAEKSGMNMQLESVMFPLDLKRRHDDLVLERNKQHRMEAMKGTQHSIRREAEQLEKQFHIENIYKKIRKIYEYDGAEYIIRVPEGAKDILQESKFLDHCIQRGTRYFERISVRESYIFFLRKKSDPNTPWYTLEVEPGGTVRQKRSYSNDQYADLEDAKPFIEEWQQVVQGRMTASEISFAKQSKEIRAQEFAELKENGNIIRTGANAGKLLVDELMHDLMEVEKRVG